MERLLIVTWNNNFAIEDDSIMNCVPWQKGISFGGSKSESNKISRKRDSAGSPSGEVCRLNSWLLVTIDFLIESIAFVFSICIYKNVKSIQSSANITRGYHTRFPPYFVDVATSDSNFSCKINLPVYTVMSVNNKKRTDELLSLNSAVSIISSSLHVIFLYNNYV